MFSFDYFLHVLARTILMSPKNVGGGRIGRTAAEESAKNFFSTAAPAFRKFGACSAKVGFFSPLLDCGYRKQASVNFLQREKSSRRHLSNSRCPPSNRHTKEKKNFCVFRPFSSGGSHQSWKAEQNMGPREH